MIFFRLPKKSNPPGHFFKYQQPFVSDLHKLQQRQRLQRLPPETIGSHHFGLLPAAPGCWKVLLQWKVPMVFCLEKTINNPDPILINPQEFI